jgi:hypothetical protein
MPFKLPPVAAGKVPVWLAAVLAAIAAGLGVLGNKALTPTPAPEVVYLPAPAEEHDGDDQQAAGATGWVSDPVAVAQVLTGPTAPVPFDETPAFRDGPEPDGVYLWKAQEQVTGRPVTSKNQGSVGSCVSFGTNTAIERTIAAGILSGGQGEWRPIAEEVTYGGSRVEVGGGRIRGDGSIGAWAAQFVNRYGVVTRDRHGRHDLSRYSEALAREYGRRGVPDDLEPVAKAHPVKEVALVRDWASAKKALGSGYGIAVCSSQGFSMQRDAKGVAAPRGTWFHCMAVDGYHKDADGREYGHVENSWGEHAHRGPVGWGDPPKSGFWADSRVIDRMLRQGDSWCFSDVAGFPARAVPAAITAPHVKP